MNPEDLLLRLAGTLKRDIAPAVEADYPRTQAHLASVVLAKLALQLRLAAAHAEADRVELERLFTDLEGPLAAAGSPPLNAAFTVLRNARDDQALAAFIATLYARRETLGDARFAALLARVRRTLRARLDRQMAYCA